LWGGGWGGGWGWGGYPVDSGFVGYASSYYPSYDYGYGPGVVAQNYGQQIAPSPPAPPVQVQVFQGGVSVQPGDTIYLIAFKDHRIQAAIAYWVDANVLHYVTREHEQKQVLLESIDRAFTEQLNRDLHVQFSLGR
jgi:hypothetical protein